MDEIGCSLLLIIAAFIVAFGVDAAYFGRKSFAAETACEVKRMEARRQFWSTNVICVPAYRATKDDTLTLQGVR